MSIAVDTQILIFGMEGMVSKTITEKNKHFYIRSKILIEIATEQNEELVVPTISLAEILVPLSPANRRATIAAFTKNFDCREFNVQAAQIAAELWQFHRHFKKDDDYDRRVLSADIKIIATAAAANAQTFYSFDEKCRKIASEIMTAKEPPSRHPDMFVDKEINDEVQRHVDATAERSTKKAARKK